MASQDRVLREILKEVCDGTIQLPDFQRDWVWDDNRIKALIVSLACRLGFQPNNNFWVQFCAIGCKNSAKNE